MSTPEEVRLLVVEDHQIIRLGLKLLLDEIPGFQVVAVAEDGNQAVQKVLEQQPDVVLMEIGLPEVNGIEATARIKAVSPRTRVVIFTSHETNDDVFAAIGAGADGYLLKDAPTLQLVRAIKTVNDGGTWLDPKIARRVVQTSQKVGAQEQADSDQFALQESNLDLLVLVERGLSNEEIARELGATVEQVRQEMRFIIERLFLSDKGDESVKQIRRQFAAHLGDGIASQKADTIEALESSATLAIGDLFANRYLIQSSAGRGGVGRVYKAKHLHMNRTVAIKVLLPHLAQDRRVVRLFKDEARAASALIHPNTVTIYDYGETKEGQPFLVMDYIEGKSLDEILRHEPYLELDRFIAIFGQVCDVLAAAHAKDIIHCDLKPSNVVLLPCEGGPETVKLVDFGLAKILPPRHSGVQMQLTDGFDVAGSPPYMSPEQCCGKKLDARSDLYSLGCVMYEALTGVQAMYGTTPMECMSKHIQEMPQTFAQALPDRKIPAELEAIVFKLLAKAPDARYQTALEVKSVLMNVLAKELASTESNRKSAKL